MQGRSIGFDIHRQSVLPEVEEAVRESEETLPAATVSCVYCVSRGKIHRRQSLDLLTAPMSMPTSIKPYVHLSAQHPCARAHSTYPSEL